VLPHHLVLDRVVGPAFFREHRMQRFDRFVGTDHGRGTDELRQELAAKQPVVIQLLVSVLEHRDVLRVGPLAVLGTQLQAAQQIGPEVGHDSGSR
jgi:hypothetical protein